MCSSQLALEINIKKEETIRNKLRTLEYSPSLYGRNKWGQLWYYEDEVIDFVKRIM